MIESDYAGVRMPYVSNVWQKEEVDKVINKTFGKMLFMWGVLALCLAAHAEAQDPLGSSICPSLPLNI